VAAKDEHWTHTLFNRYPELFLPLLVRRIKDTVNEVSHLCEIFEELSVPSNGKILDLCCGIGRHSINLAKRGYTVVGYDPSKFYIQKAIRWMKEEQVDTTKLDFYHGDPYKVSQVLSENEHSFDAVIIMDNSFGYKDDYHDIQMLTNILRIASRTCVLVLQVENRDWRLKNFETHIIEEFDTTQLRHTWKFNYESSKSEGNFKFYEKAPPTGSTLRLLLDLGLSLRLYSLHELKNVAECSGWVYIKSNGYLDMTEPVSDKTPDIVMICNR